MKPFKINRDSWHYRLNMKFANSYGTSSWGRSVWENHHRDFCSYWRATVLRSLFAVLLTCFGVFALVGLGSIIYQNPIDFAIAFGLIVGFVATVIAGVALINYVQDRIDSRNRTYREPKPEGLVAQRYRAYKSRICPMIEYDK